MFDVVVIGAGPGGYVAAIKGAQMGGKVALVEGATMGGTCLNVGCIPTKALVHSASTYLGALSAHEFGVEAKEVTLNMGAVMDHKRKTVQQLVSGVEKLVEGNGVAVYKGWAKIPSPGKVEVTLEDGTTEILDAKNIVIATGSKHFTLPFLQGHAVTSDHLLELDYVPERLCIIGGGVIGIEFACIFSAFGAEVTVIELLRSILPNTDQEIARRLALMLRRRGIKIHTSTQVTEVGSDGETKIVLAKGKDGAQMRFEADLVLSAVGRVPNFGGVDLDALGIAYDKKGIKVDGRMATNVPGIWAIGDVVGRTLLAHGASAEGITVMENIFRSPRTMDYSAIPACVFSIPECSSVGYTEQEAKQQGLQVKISKFPFGANGKALSMGATDGLVKVLADGATGKVIGMHILGAHADDLIHLGSMAVQLGLGTEQLQQLVYAHPTLSEAVMEAFYGLGDGPVHLLSRR
jgi:dihydrolipoamide dehydrogenase